MITMTSTKLINNHVIFSFDDPFDIHNAAKLYRYLDTRRALGDLTYTPIMAMGSYKGVLEPSIMMDYNDYMAHVVGSGYVDNQESILVLNPRSPRTVAMRGVLTDINGGLITVLGSWEQVSKEQALQCEAWTYMDTKYFVCGDDAHVRTTSYGLSEFAQANYGRGYTD
jgi:hypothetical protein